MVDFTILPAIDVVSGQAVRLTQGDLSQKTVYGNPVTVAQDFAQLGAQWLHFVDLDAAFGRGSNAELMAEVISETSLKVELTGGIRDDQSLMRALETGCARVNLGTAAIEKPEWTKEVIQEFGERIAIGIDVRGERIAIRGWTQEGPELAETVESLSEAGCSRFVVTDISRDGTLTGPNLDLLKRFHSLTPARIIASGGVATLEDIKALAQLTDFGVEGVIVGKALYSGAIDLKHALQLLAGEL